MAVAYCNGFTLMNNVHIRGSMWHIEGQTEIELHFCVCRPNRKYACNCDRNLQIYGASIKNQAEGTGLFTSTVHAEKLKEFCSYYQSVSVLKAVIEGSYEI